MTAAACVCPAVHACRSHLASRCLPAPAHSRSRLLGFSQRKRTVIVQAAASEMGVLCSVWFMCRVLCYACVSGRAGLHWYVCFIYFVAQLVAAAFVG
jgi:hypothetical protein